MVVHPFLVQARWLISFVHRTFDQQRANAGAGSCNYQINSIRMPECDVADIGTRKNKTLRVIAIRCKPPKSSTREPTIRCER
jgi:hypothetical protein